VLITGMDKAPTRNVEEPLSEPDIRGPREGFVEQVQTNTILLRRRLRTPHLKIESITVGKLSQTKVAIAYIDGIATDSVVQELRNRITQIEIDGGSTLDISRNSSKTCRFPHFRKFRTQSGRTLPQPICWKAKSLFWLMVRLSYSWRR